MKIKNLLMALVFVLGLPTLINAEDKCLYDNYSPIRYWIDMGLSISDYNYGSKDAESLGLVVQDGKHFTKTSSKLLSHFYNEFERLIKQDLPVYNDDDDRFQDVRELMQTKEMNIAGKLEDMEKVRRIGRYGTHPGSLFCTIRISRREFPVLYLTECYIIANLYKEKSDRRALDFGFAKPENIEKELMISTTRTLERLRQRRPIYLPCPNK
jgi:hypothetical protein